MIVYSFVFMNCTVRLPLFTAFVRFTDVLFVYRYNIECNLYRIIEK